ncbi:MAG: peptide chain release factor N(5)-glutamine methyltransferase [Erysipelotrichaceae bacterium]
MISQILRKAEKHLADHDIPPNYAKYVLNELLNKQNRNLYLEMNQDLDSETLLEFNHILERLCLNEPLAYILGVQYFYGYPIAVNPSVLIPRPETEELVMRVLMNLDEHKHIQSLVDIGTGSGAIAIALKKEAKHLTVYASDISNEALIQAQTNAKTLDADIHFLLGSMLDPLIDQQIKVDMIVCNPPYIPQAESIETSVKEFEPHVALFGGDDGLFFYKEVLKHASKVLNPNGMIAFEIGWNQKMALLKETRKVFSNAKIEVFVDMQGKDRIMLIQALA